jgi:ParB-like nuclease family protein
VSDQLRPAATRRTWLDRQLEGCQTGRCLIDDLLSADSPRLSGEVDEHVRLLAESLSPLPAIVVHQPSMRVIDGMHRLGAAKLRGDTEIQVRWFDGDERDAFAIAVQANVAHGLPLSLADRRQAAARIIESHMHWSDRMIASIVNLAPATVHAVRTRSTAQIAPSNARLGSDGRTRPISTAEGRRLAAELFRDNPDAPLRKIASATGLAPSTVLDVRKRIREGRDPVPSEQRRRMSARSQPTSKTSPEETWQARHGDYAAAFHKLRKDPSLRYNNTGRMLLSWFQMGPMDVGTRSSLVGQLPSHCLAAVATLARGQAAAWHDFALQITDRNAHGFPRNQSEVS